MQYIINKIILKKKKMVITRVVLKELSPIDSNIFCVLYYLLRFSDFLGERYNSQPIISHIELFPFLITPQLINQFQKTKKWSYLVGQLGAFLYNLRPCQKVT